MSKQETAMRDLLIKDPELIQKYKQIIKTEGVYIPPQRDDSTMDLDAMKEGRHARSIDMIGQQSAISITINESDPEKASQNSPFRTHLRLGDGVHRWRQTEAKGQVPIDTLEIKFYSVKSFEEYSKLKALLDQKKADNPAEKKLDIESVCESIFKNGTPKEKVSAKVKDLYAGIIPESTLNEFIPQKFKEKSKMREGKKKEEKTPEQSEKELSKKDEQIQKMISEITTLTKETVKLADEKKQLRTELDKAVEVISFVKLEKTVKVEGLENVNVSVSFDLSKKEFLVRKA
jgi:hypothetical protein